MSTEETNQSDVAVEKNSNITNECKNDLQSESSTAEDNVVNKKTYKSHLVQIQASNEEINRRINALIERKQCEVDENNCQEFCGVHPALKPIDGTCARTSSVFVPRAGGKSHIKVSRVVNMYGPQTRSLGSGNNTRTANEIKQENSLIDGIEERLSNMEQHLKITDSSKTGVFSRLKNLEQRILFLESLSPEYFTTGPPSSKKKRQDLMHSPSLSSSNQDLTLTDIDSRIQMLRDSLLKRSNNT